MNETVIITKEIYEAYKRLAEAIYYEGAFSPYDDVIKNTRILFTNKKQFIKEFADEISEELSAIFPLEQSILIKAKIREVLAKNIGE